MKRKSIIPYGETTILSLSNINTGTKFQFIAQVKKIDKNKIFVTDGHEDLELIVEIEEIKGLEVGGPVLVFGEKLESKIKKEKIISLNLEWDLYLKTRELESR